VDYIIGYIYSSDENKNDCCILLHIQNSDINVVSGCLWNRSISHASHREGRAATAASSLVGSSQHPFLANHLMQPKFDVSSVSHQLQADSGLIHAYLAKMAEVLRRLRWVTSTSSATAKDEPKSFERSNYIKLLYRDLHVVLLGTGPFQLMIFRASQRIPLKYLSQPFRGTQWKRTCGRSQDQIHGSAQDAL
jgi:hypothetical protein